MILYASSPSGKLPQASLCFASRSAARFAIRSYMAAMSSIADCASPLRISSANTHWKCANAPT